jgi:hypothetical protein
MSERDDDIRERFSRVLSGIPDRDVPPVEAISKRARRHRVRRGAAAALVAGGLAVALVTPLIVIGRLGSGSHAVSHPTPSPPKPAASVTTPSTPSPESSSDLPDVGRLRCDENGTAVVTPMFRPQPDGVHFEVDNRTGRNLSFDVADQGGRNAPPGVHEVEEGMGWSIPPGAIRVRCLDPLQGIDTPYVDMTVEDPDGLWAPDTPDCAYGGSVGISDYASGSKGDPDPVEVARKALGSYFQEGDEFRFGGYPEAPSPVVVVLRNGVVFASVELQGDLQGGWLASTTSRCGPPPPPREVVEVNCNDLGTHAPDEAIHRQSDGVHFQVDNPQDGPVLLEVEGVGSATSPPGLRDLPYPPTGELGWPIEAGTIRVRCSGSGVPVRQNDDGWHDVVIEPEAFFFPTWNGKDRPQAGVSGVLTEHDQCLFLAANGEEVLALWEAGYFFADGMLLDSVGLPVARVGDLISGGGGYGSDWTVAEQIVGRAIPDRCRPAGTEPYALIYDVRAGPFGG